MTAQATERSDRRETAGPIDSRDLPAYLLCFLGGLVFNMFAGNSKLLGFPIPPDRVLFALSITLLALDPVARRDVRPTLRPVHIVIVALTLLVTWSALVTGTLTTSFGFYGLLDTVVMPFVAFVMAPYLFRTPERRDLLLRLLVAIGLYLGATAVLEIVGPHALVWPRFIMDPAVGLHFGRARGPFVESVAAGLAMAFCAFAATYGLARFRGVWRLLSGATVLLCGVGIVLCLTRSVWLGTAVGALIVGVTTPRLRRLIPGVLVGAAALVVIALAVIPGLQDAANERASTQRSLWDRQTTNAAAVRIVADRPLDGVGWMNFIAVSPDLVRQSPDYPITHIAILVHNVFLSRAAELGIPGGLLTIAAVLLGPVAAMRRRVRGDLVAWRGVLTAGGVAWLFACFLTPMPYPLLNLLPWLLAGIVLQDHLTRPVGARDDYARSASHG